MTKKVAITGGAAAHLMLAATLAGSGSQFEIVDNFPSRIKKKPKQKAKKPWYTVDSPEVKAMSK